MGKRQVPQGLCVIAYNGRALHHVATPTSLLKPVQDPAHRVNNATKGVPLAVLMPNQLLLQGDETRSPAKVENSTGRHHAPTHGHPYDIHKGVPRH